MANYKELSAKIAALMQEAEAARKTERNAALAEIRATMARHDISVADLALPTTRRGRSESAAKVPAKYVHPLTGERWSGRGLKPRWLTAELAAGKPLESFIVA